MADCVHVWVIEDTYEDEFAKVEYKRCMNCPATTSDTTQK